VKGSRDLRFKFWDPLHISGTVTIQYKFIYMAAISWIKRKTITHKQNTHSKLHYWRGKGSRGLLFKFWDPLYISGTVEARNIKYGMQIGGPKRNNAKSGQKGSWRGHV